MQLRQFTLAHIRNNVAIVRHRVPFLTALLALALSTACGSSKLTKPAPDAGEVGTLTDSGTRRRDAGEVGADGGAVREACTEPLKIDPSNAFVLPLDLLTLVPSG